MSKFTASNGVTITLDFEGDYVFGGASAGYTIKPEGAHEQALREFFQAEADERLGRWRDPEDSVFYVYSGGAWDGVFSPIRVVAETNGASWLLDRDDHEPSVPPKVLAVARRFFDAHPEPKPWHDAKPGEVWALTWDGTEGVFLHAGGSWYGQGDMRVVLGHPIHDKNVTAGRRIWPEVSS